MNQSFINRTSEFERDQKRKSPPTSKPASLASNGNPYLQARLDILSKMQEWRRNEIKEMEKTGDTDNRFYLDFVHDVAILGDTYENQSSEKK